METFKMFFERFKNYVLILLGVAVVFIALATKAVTSIVSYVKMNGDYKTAQATIVDKQRELEEIEQRIKKLKEGDDNKLLKAFYMPIDKGFDTESIIANEFAEILFLIRANSVKTRAINYTYDPPEDAFVKNAGGSFNVAKLDIDMVANYKDFESFLKELYKHQHFLDISAIELTPYAKNKRILLIKFQLKLYAKK